MSVLPRVLVKGINFKKLLFSGNRLSGAWSTLGSSDVSILMANAGLDYIPATLIKKRPNNTNF